MSTDVKAGAASDHDRAVGSGSRTVKVVAVVVGVLVVVLVILVAVFFWWRSPKVPPTAPAAVLPENPTLPRTAPAAVLPENPNLLQNAAVLPGRTGDFAPWRITAKVIVTPGVQSWKGPLRPVFADLDAQVSGFAMNRVGVDPDGPIVLEQTVAGLAPGTAYRFVLAAYAGDASGGRLSLVVDLAVDLLDAGSGRSVLGAPAPGTHWRYSTSESSAPPFLGIDGVELVPIAAGPHRLQITAQCTEIERSSQVPCLFVLKAQLMRAR